MSRFFLYKLLLIINLSIIHPNDSLIEKNVIEQQLYSGTKSLLNKKIDASTHRLQMLL
ncbi:hypothetical protein [Jeotgalibacillus proteolyticus]|uniref:hypothetical protein n=1 Tax=Jeotgalibacillus proteolyticus TaxID=2082395 RepID=UPI001430E038|nr:hypothetical protein [Jeotgalibacillus proteolyticus]